MGAVCSEHRPIFSFGRATLYWYIIALHGFRIFIVVVMAFAAFPPWTISCGVFAKFIFFRSLLDCCCRGLINTYCALQTTTGTPIWTSQASILLLSSRTWAWINSFCATRCVLLLFFFSSRECEPATAPAVVSRVLSDGCPGSLWPPIKSR